MSTFRLPDLGEGLQEAEIVAWHVAPGDHVIAGQPLLSVETDKAVIEVPSPRSATIGRLCAAEGERVCIGAPLVDFEERGADMGAIVGDLAPAIATDALRSMKTTAKSPRVSPITRAQIVPSARILANRLGIDPTTVIGTGPGGVITASDIRVAAEARPRADQPPAPAGLREGYAPLRGPRRAMAEAMTLSGRSVVPATITDEANLFAWSREIDVTLRLVRAISVALEVEPTLNAWFDGEALARRIEARLDLAVAIDAPEGLYTPVLRDAATLTPASLRVELDRLEEAVRSRRIALSEMQEATFTLSNFGTIGGRHASLVVVPPQVAILGAGRIYVSPSGPALPLSLTFDHRAVTGGEAARFLGALRADFERPT